MNNTDVKQLLDPALDIQLTVSIDELLSLPSSTLYRQLSKHKRTTYQNNDRFVFTNFYPVDQQILTHIRNILRQLDIPHFFVLVVTNQSNTQEFFDSWTDDPVTLLYVDCADVVPINHGHQPVFNTDGVMCPHAWTGLHVNPNGTARLCCEYRDTIKNDAGEEFNVHRDNIDQIVNSTYMIGIRNQFRSGQTPAACHSCVQSEKMGGNSKRRLTPVKLDNIYGLVDWESDQSTKSFLGGHLGNLCNLKCRICSERYSTSIASEKIRLATDDAEREKIHNVLRINSWGKDHKNFWELVKQNPTFVNFEILGGEPLLISQNLQFVDYLIEHGLSQSCNFEFVTNGTQDLNFLEKIRNFRKFHVTFSIDNVDKRFELERSGASWHAVSNNLMKYLMYAQQNDNLDLGVSITVNIQNVLYLPELIHRLRSLGLSSHQYYYNLLTTPEYLSIKNVTLQARSLILHKLTSASLDSEDQQKLAYVINILKFANTSDGTEFCRYMQHLDQVRQESFYLTHTEIAQAMGYTN